METIVILDYRTSRVIFAEVPEATEEAYQGLLQQLSLNDDECAWMGGADIVLKRV